MHIIQEFETTRNQADSNYPFERLPQLKALPTEKRSKKCAWQRLCPTQEAEII
jgi:hypothetical protein